MNQEGMTLPSVKISASPLIRSEITEGNERSEGKEKTSGVLVVDKPIGMTSHDVVQVIRHGTSQRRAGHTGTLDPRASGVLVILLGPAVRLSEYVSASDKRYQATIYLGSATDTYDSEGVVTQSANALNVSESHFQEELKKYIGEIEQTPPPYSAVKVHGRKAYELSRQGEKVELKPRNIKVYSLDILEWDPPEVIVDVFCSSGTYVRSLAHDIGQSLGCGAHLVGLRRTKSGRFTLRDATSLSTLKDAFAAGNWQKYIIPAAEALVEWHAVELTMEQVVQVRNGHRIAAPPNSSGYARGMNERGELIAVLECVPEVWEWRPRKVFSRIEDE